MKLLQGYVKGRTKEAALAIVMLALFFVARTCKITIVPGIFLLDFSPAIVFTAATIFSWPYTILFSLVNLYLGSNIFLLVFWFTGSQIVFFLSRVLKDKKWVPHIPVFGQLGTVFYSLLMHTMGLMDVRVYFTVYGGLILIASAATYIGGLIIWKALKTLIPGDFSI